MALRHPVLSLGAQIGGSAVGGRAGRGCDPAVVRSPGSLPPHWPAPQSLPFRPPAGGFATFSSCFPGLCEGKPAALLPVSLSQPCLPVPSVGLTRILPHLYLGSQKDVLNKVCAGPWGKDTGAQEHAGLVWRRKGAEG